MYVVAATFDAEAFIEQHLSSVFAQVYPRGRVRHVVIDDASTDDTAGRIERWRARHPAHPLEYVRNPVRIGGCANLTREFRRAPFDSIVLQVDGDDWLSDPLVFDFLNRMYQDRSVWMTYNTWRFPDGSPSANSEPIPAEVVERRAYRDYRWISSHLHSFRRQLFEHVEDQSLRDPETGDYWSASVDMSHYFPMLELAGHHARHVHRITYVYNLHERSLINWQRPRQLACEDRLRKLPRYQPLHRL